MPNVHQILSDAAMPVYALKPPVNGVALAGLEYASTQEGIGRVTFHYRGPGGWAQVDNLAIGFLKEIDQERLDWSMTFELGQKHDLPGEARRIDIETGILSTIWNWTDGTLMARLSKDQSQSLVFISAGGELAHGLDVLVPRLERSDNSVEAMSSLENQMEWLNRPGDDQDVN